jgi:hypothetical protein
MIGTEDVMMALRRIALLAFLMTATSQAYAAGIGIRAGTTGVGIDVGWSVIPTLSARIGYSALGFNTSVNTSDVDYDGKVRLSNLSGLLDWSPLGPLRITVGLVGADNKVDIKGTPAGSTYTINGNTYQASDVVNLNGTVKVGHGVNPYLGFGYGNVGGAGVNIYFDIGVMIQGSPRTRLTANCGVALSPAQCAQLQDDVEVERLKVQDKLNNYKLYPVASIGITVGF